MVSLKSLRVCPHVVSAWGHTCFIERLAPVGTHVIHYTHEARVTHNQPLTKEFNNGY